MERIQEAKQEQPLEQNVDKPIRIVAVSDTHNAQIDVPEGDVYIHCGDFTGAGSIIQIQQFCAYLSKLKFKHKIVIAGNHELGLDIEYNRNSKSHKYHTNSQFITPEKCAELKQLMKRHCTYLEHESVEVEGIKIFGSPYTPQFYDWAFMYQPENAGNYWAIDEKVDILVTHGPPFGILDRAHNQCCGCPTLQDAVFNKIKPKYHLFGHIHPGYGHQQLDNIHFYNCSQLDDHYSVVNKPFVIEYRRK